MDYLVNMGDPTKTLLSRDNFKPWFDYRCVSYIGITFNIIGQTKYLRKNHEWGYCCHIILGIDSNIILCPKSIYDQVSACQIEISEI